MAFRNYYLFKVIGKIRFINKETKMIKKNWKCGGDGAAGGAVYGLGLIGAVIYFIQNASGFSDGVIGVLKALVWPAFLVYEALQLFKM